MAKGFLFFFVTIWDSSCIFPRVSHTGPGKTDRLFSHTLPGGGGGGACVMHSQKLDPGGWLAGWLAG